MTSVPTTDPPTTDLPTTAVHWRLEPDALVVTLTRPPANALGDPVVAGLAAALDAAETAGARILVSECAVPGFFAAGADIKQMAASDLDGFTAYGDRLRAVLDRLERYAGVSIAAVEGAALGGGLELALASTLRVAGAGAAFGLPEVRIGLIPGAGGTQRLPRLVGRGRALDLVLTARRVPADEAHAIGLVDRLVAEGDAVTTALALARELGRSSASALAAGVRAVAAAYDDGDGFAVERAEVGALFQGDGAEGLKAFVEKRKPSFS